MSAGVPHCFIPQKAPPVVARSEHRVSRRSFPGRAYPKDLTPLLVAVEVTGSL